MTQFLGSPKIQYFDGNGDPLSGGLLYTYEGGTLTNKATYPTIADSLAATNANANPVVLDSRGEANVVLSGNTKLVLKDSDAVTVWTVDNVDTHPTQVDANGNELLTFTTVASAVNNVDITNASTGNAPIIDVIGGDTNVGLTIDTKGTGTLTLGSIDSVVSVLGSSVTLATDDATNNDITNTLTLTHTTSGTPAANLGTGILMKSESADESPSDAGRLDFHYTDVTAGSEDTVFRIQNRVAGAALTDAYKFANTGGFAYTVTGAPTAARAIAIPDADTVLIAKVGETTASASASVAFTGLTNEYQYYKLVIQAYLPATDNTALHLQVSADGGSTYISTGYYFGASRTGSGLVSNDSADNGSAFLIASATSSSTDENTFSEACLYNIGESKRFAATWTSGGVNAAGTGSVVSGGGLVITSDINAIRVLSSSGNITSGIVTLYGVL